MAKVEGPLMSLTASGTYRGALTFRQVAGQTVVGAPPIPTVPASPAQGAIRLKVSQMAFAWRTMDTVDKEAWKNCAATMGLRGRDLFWKEWFAQGSSPGNPPTVPCP